MARLKRAASVPARARPDQPPCDVLQMRSNEMRNTRLLSLMLVERRRRLRPFERTAP